MASAEELQKIINNAKKNPEQINECCNRLERLLSDIEQYPYQFSQVFCVVYENLLENFFCTSEKETSKGGAWIDTAPARIKRLCNVDGAFFKVVFDFDNASFPGLSLDIAKLPPPTQWLLKNPTASFPPLSDLYSVDYRRNRKSIELNMCEYFFVYFALHAVHHRAKSSQGSSQQWRLNMHFHTAKRTASGEDVYLQLLDKYLAFFLPTNDNSAVMSQPYSLQFVLALSEFWLNQNSVFIVDKQELKSPTPPTKLQLTCISRFIEHLMRDPAVRYNANNDHDSLRDMALTCMSPELQVVRRPLFNFLFTTFRTYDALDWTKQLSTVLSIWLFFIAPEKRGDPNFVPCQPYIIFNFPFYTILVKSFLELLPKLDLRYKFEGVSKSKSKSKETLGLLAKINRLLSIIVHLSSDDKNKLLPELEKRFLRRSRVTSGKLPYDSHELQNLLFESYSFLLSPDFPPNPLFDPNSSASEALFQKLKDIFELDETEYSAYTSTNPKVVNRDRNRTFKVRDEIVQNCYHLFGKRLDERELRERRSSVMTANGLLLDLGQMQFKWQWARENLPQGAASKLVEYLPKAVAQCVVKRSRKQSESEWTPYPEYGEDGKLTAEGREQLISGQRMCSNLDVPFLGDEWDRPVRSWESTAGVVLAKWMSQFLNSKFGVDWNLRPLASWRLELFLFLLIYWLFFW